MALTGGVELLISLRCSLTYRAKVCIWVLEIELIVNSAGFNCRGLKPYDDE